MKHTISKIMYRLLWGIALSATLSGGVNIVFAETMYDYTKIPAFLEVGLNPNLLLLIDNSASMFDPAYRNSQGDNYCYVRGVEDLDGDGAIDTDLNNDGNTTTSDTEDVDGDGILDVDYDAAVTYSGYFNPAAGSWYKYIAGQFETVSAADAATFCSTAAGTKYTGTELCLTIDETPVAPAPDVVTAFAAKGRLLNWLMSSKFDVEKKVLTGGRYDPVHFQAVLESRGCDSKRFIKDIPIGNGGSYYVATFGIRPPTALEKNADLLFNGALSNTRLDIYGVSKTGMIFADCSDAIEAFAAGNLGNVKSETKACLDPMGTGLFASQTAFNHIMQECWYYNKHQAWQGGNGTVTSLVNDCENVYNATPGAAPGGGYSPPEDQNGSDVCYGQYDPTHPVGGPWGVGYIGQCWEPQAGAFVWQDRTCIPASDPTTNANPFCNTNAGFGTVNVWYVCDGSYNASQHKCVGSPGNWVKVQDAVPGAGGITSVDWTNDDPGLDVNPKPQGYTCVDASLKKYCQGLDEPTTIDPSDYTDPQGTAWGLPALLVDAATQSQLGNPLLSAMGRIAMPNPPAGLIQEFKYNLRLGAMEFNTGPKSECYPLEQPVGSGRYIASLYDCLLDKGAAIHAGSLPDPSKRNGGRVISYIDDGITHNSQLVTAINNIEATAWTPTSEALFNAIGYYTQDNVNNLRLDPADFIWDHDAAALGVGGWTNATLYNPGDKVKFTHNWDHNGDGAIDETETKLYFTNDGGTSNSSTGSIEDDLGVKWTSYDPIIASCQTNNILIITDGAATADYDGVNATSPVTDFVATHNDTVLAETWQAGITEGTSYECKGIDSVTGNPVSTLFGSTMMDDLVYYANKNGASIYQGTYQTVEGEDKKNIVTHIVVANTLQVPADPNLECEPKNILGETSANAGTVLIEASNPDELDQSLRDVFESIGGEPASGSAASVISNSRSGEGAIYQAVFYPKQIDSSLREITWAGDVHSLWLDDRGNIREDCSDTGCLGTPQDFTLVSDMDNILEFYTDPVNNSARARRYSDADGDDHYDAADFMEDNVKLNELHYLWSAGEWLAGASSAQKGSYAATANDRYIFTSTNGTTAIAFTPATLAGALGATYPGYFNAADAAEADKIVNYIRGVDQVGYRSREIDWDGDGITEIWKLGDIVYSTPTVVSQPAEDYDTIYQDKSYQAFRALYRNRRTMVYAGGNDGGLHAFNGGHYDRATRSFLKGPPGKVQYDLGAEMWMYIPKNLWPHLKWLTDVDYSHVFYVDQKPYIFDAKIFDPTDLISGPDHPGGWGTILVAGMRFGGGNIGVDLNGDGTDDQTMRSAYIMLDITNPEVPPKLLAEFTDPNLGFTVGAPTAIPMLRCGLKVSCPDQDITTWPMDWYLALSSGPYDPALPLQAMQGQSSQLARLYILKLGGTGGFALPYVTTAGMPAVQAGFPLVVNDPGTFPNSFFSDVIAVDHDLNFKVDSLYFGSIANSNLDHNLHTGGMHRLVLDDDLDPAQWYMNTFFATPGHQPVMASPSVASDGFRAWVYFGTGRYLAAGSDKKAKAPQSYYGLKETYDAADQLDLSLTNSARLIDTSSAWVENVSGDLNGVIKDTDGALINSATFTELNNKISERDLGGLDYYHGWKIDFDLDGERNLGQAAILGNVVTFTTFVPSETLCSPEGYSYLWAPFYRTGTAYRKSVIGSQTTAGVTTNLRKIDVGIGLATTPNIHSGSADGTKAFVQTSTGAIITVEQSNPGAIRSGMQTWRELSN
ncbi:MAG: hypothetical protein KJ950_06900 [Proteobacteria bacterium]|nr:hypothetical protein [Pseudomonadota bacterium]MBU1686769.1 hypothetical protein [Pseudomonadota bacterium]